MERVILQESRIFGTYNTFHERVETCKKVREYLQDFREVQSAIKSLYNLGRGKDGGVTAVNFPSNAACKVQDKPCASALKRNNRPTLRRQLEFSDAQVDNVYREAVAAICVTELVTQSVSPHFMMCFAAFETGCGTIDMFSELINGQLLMTMAKNLADLTVFRVMLFQVVHAMLAMEIHLGMSHSDIHSENIMAMRVNETAYTYHLGNGATYTVPTYGMCWVFIDFGRATSKVLFDDDPTIFKSPNTELDYLKKHLSTFGFKDYHFVLMDELIATKPAKGDYTVIEDLTAKLEWLAQPIAEKQISKTVFDMSRKITFNVQGNAFLCNFYAATFYSNEVPIKVDLHQIYAQFMTNYQSRFTAEDPALVLSLMSHPFFQPDRSMVTHIFQSAIQSGVQKDVVNKVLPYFSNPSEPLLLVLKKMALTTEKEKYETLVTTLSRKARQNLLSIDESVMRVFLARCILDEFDTASPYALPLWSISSMDPGEYDTLQSKEFASRGSHLLLHGSIDTIVSQGRLQIIWSPEEMDVIRRIHMPVVVEVSVKSLEWKKLIAPTRPIVKTVPVFTESSNPSFTQELRIPEDIVFPPCFFELYKDQSLAKNALTTLKTFMLSWIQPSATLSLEFLSLKFKEAPKDIKICWHIEVHSDLKKEVVHAPANFAGTQEEFIDAAVYTVFPVFNLTVSPYIKLEPGTVPRINVELQEPSFNFEQNITWDMDVVEAKWSDLEGMLRNSSPLSSALQRFSFEDDETKMVLTMPWTKGWPSKNLETLKSSKDQALLKLRAQLRLVLTYFQYRLEDVDMANKAIKAYLGETLDVSKLITELQSVSSAKVFTPSADVQKTLETIFDISQKITPLQGTTLAGGPLLASWCEGAGTNNIFDVTKKATATACLRCFVDVVGVEFYVSLEGPSSADVHERKAWMDAHAASKVFYGAHLSWPQTWCLQAPVFFSINVPDYTVPPQQVMDLVSTAAFDRVPTYVHCYSGHGRTGIVMLSVLVALGLIPADATIKDKLSALEHRYEASAARELNALLSVTQGQSFKHLGIPKSDWDKMYAAKHKDELPPALTSIATKFAGRRSEDATPKVGGRARQMFALSTRFAYN